MVGRASLPARHSAVVGWASVPARHTEVVGRASLPARYSAVVGRAPLPARYSAVVGWASVPVQQTRIISRNQGTHMSLPLIHLAAAAVLLQGSGSKLSPLDWPNWRGPSFNGASQVTGLPVEFSPTKNVKWAVDMPGPSSATPIVCGSRVFLSTVDTKADNLVAMCLDRSTGKELWREEVGTGYKPAGRGSNTRGDQMSTYVNASPVTDGERVAFYFGNGDLACFTVHGKKLWQRNMQQEMGDFAILFTHSCTPQFYRGKLYFLLLQRNEPESGKGKGGESALLALDPDTGKTLWRAVRPTDAIAESHETYNTPIPAKIGGVDAILLVGADYVTAHDPADGRELWRWGTYNPGHREDTWRIVPSAVAGGDVVLACAPKGAPVYAIKVTPGAAPKTAWTTAEREDITADVATPLYYKGRFYVMADLRNTLACLDPATGKTVWFAEVPLTWGSPTGADGKVYLLTRRGEAIVIDAATGRILAKNPMAEHEAEINTTIAAAHGCLFIRTTTKLYCVAAPK